MRKTYATKKSDIKVETHTVDVGDKVLGRVATQIASLLIGKSKPNFSTSINVGDKVEVLNASKVRFTGGKEQKKIYYSHSGFPGGFKEKTLQELLDSDPTEVIKKAVWGMLPKNKLRKVRMRNLKVFSEGKKEVVK